jgi:hypothetical protein
MTAPQPETTSAVISQKDFEGLLFSALKRYCSYSILSAYATASDHIKPIKTPLKLKTNPNSHCYVVLGMEVIFIGERMT